MRITALGDSVPDHSTAPLGPVPGLKLATNGAALGVSSVTVGPPTSATPAGRMSCMVVKTGAVPPTWVRITL